MFKTTTGLTKLYYIFDLHKYDKKT